MHIINPVTPDDVSTAICSVKNMELYPILLRLRPPRLDLYTRILRATPEDRTRLKYSFALDYLKYGNNMIILRDGLMLRLQGASGDNFLIFHPPADRLDEKSTHYVVPVPFNDRYIEDFVAANQNYAASLNGVARVCIVWEGYVILTPA